MLAPSVLMELQVKYTAYESAGKEENQMLKQD
jgi:hypothetical protein